MVRGWLLWFEGRWIGSSVKHFKRRFRFIQNIGLETLQGYGHNNNICICFVLYCIVVYCIVL